VIVYAASSVLLSLDGVKVSARNAETLKTRLLPFGHIPTQTRSKQFGDRLNRQLEDVIRSHAFGYHAAVVDGAAV